jgi:serine/threonine protein kinase
LKIIRTGSLASRSEIRRFKQEAQSAAQLNHPGIVPVYEVGKEGEFHFYSMAYIDGSDLEGKVRDHPMTPIDAAATVASIADAIQFAHEQGVVHRDLKPGNILVSRDGHPSVTDFGLAKRFASEEQITLQGTVLGTPAYMPPEQALGKTSAVNALSDVYSLGAVIYRLVTGRPPFQAATAAETLVQVIAGEFAPPRLLNPSIPRDLESVILKCLEYEARDRYHSAQHLSDDLRRFGRGEPTLARPISWTRQLARSAQKHFTAILVSTLFLILIGTLGLQHWGKMIRDQAERRVNALSRDEQKSDKARINELEHTILRNTRRAEIQIGSTKLQQIAKLLELGHRQEAKSILDELSKDGIGSHVSWERDYLLRLASEDNYGMRHSLRNPSTFTMNSDAPQLAISGQPNTESGGVPFANHGKSNRISVLSLSPSPGETLLPVYVPELRVMAFSPDGKQLAVAGSDARSGSQLLWLDPTDTKRQAITAAASEIIAATFSPDNKDLITVDKDGVIQQWANHKTGWSIESGEDVLAASFSKDAARVAITLTAGVVKVLSLPDGKTLNELQPSQKQPRLAVLHPHAQVVAIITWEGRLQIWDLTTGPGPAYGSKNHECLAWSPEGDFLATGHEDGEIQIREARSPGTATMIALSHAPVHSIAFTHDGGSLVTAAATGELKQWSLAQFIATAGFQTDVGEVLCADVCAETGSVAFIDGDNRLHVWDTDRPGRPQDSLSSFSIDQPNSQVQRLAWDGRKRILVALHNNGVATIHKSNGFNKEWSEVSQIADQITSLEMMGASELLVCGMANGEIRLYSTLSRDLVHTLTNHSSSVLSISVDPDGFGGASQDRSGQVSLWSIKRPVDNPDSVPLDMQSSNEVVVASAKVSVDSIDTQAAVGVTHISVVEPRGGSQDFLAGSTRLFRQIPGPDCRVVIIETATGVELLTLPIQSNVLLDTERVCNQTVVGVTVSGVIYRWHSNSNSLGHSNHR